MLLLAVATICETPRQASVVALRSRRSTGAISAPSAARGSSLSRWRASARTLTRTLGHALADGYGECFWPSLDGGHYWWMLRRDHDTLEVAVMWSRGGASGWQRVFRATDAAAWVNERVTSETDRLGLTT